MGNNKFEAIFGEMTPERQAALEEAKKETAARQSRKENSYFICRVPDISGNGGMVEFWINEDGTYESDNSYYTDSKIMDAIAALLRR